MRLEKQLPASPPSPPSAPCSASRALFHQVSLSLHPAARDHFSVDLYSRDANGATDISLLAIIVVTISAHLVNLNEGKETKNTREEELHYEACYALLLDDASRGKIDPAEVWRA